MTNFLNIWQLPQYCLFSENIPTMSNRFILVYIYYKFIFLDFCGDEIKIYLKNERVKKKFRK